MTELIVALDGPDPRNLRYRLHEGAGVTWFKVGPQVMANTDWPSLMLHGRDIRTFLDLKLADTADTVREAVRRFADAGVTAVSTFTTRATAAALEGARGTPLRVWRVVCLTDDPRPTDAARATSLARRDGANGIVCPPHLVSGMPYRRDQWDVVCPAVRLAGDPRTLTRADGHHTYRLASECAELGISHAVVGRPIWQAPDPVAAALSYLEALRSG